MPSSSSGKVRAVDMICQRLEWHDVTWCEVPNYWYDKDIHRFLCWRSPLCLSYHNHTLHVCTIWNEVNTLFIPSHHVASPCIITVHIIAWLSSTPVVLCGGVWAHGRQLCELVAFSPLFSGHAHCLWTLMKRKIVLQNIHNISIYRSCSPSLVVHITENSFVSSSLLMLSFFFFKSACFDCIVRS